jgi:hypothetical protein
MDQLPEILGVKQAYGEIVHHCPYCDGWKHRDQARVALGDSTAAPKLGAELLAWPDQLTVCKKRRDDPGGRPEARSTESPYYHPLERPRRRSPTPIFLPIGERAKLAATASADGFDRGSGGWLRAPAAPNSAPRAVVFKTFSPQFRGTPSPSSASSSSSATLSHPLARQHLGDACHGWRRR